MNRPQLTLFDRDPATSAPLPVDAAALLGELRAFTWEGKRTDEQTTMALVGERRIAVPLFVNEFWTRRQRAASSLHEISYRACFKPQLPRFFVERLTAESDTVYDPFLGRGTTMIEAALLGRRVVGCDINPLSSILTAPRLRPPTVRDVREQLAKVDWNYDSEVNEELLTFYHRDTLREICALRSYLQSPEAGKNSAEVDNWIRMVATNRLTGHSAGFFS